MASELSMEDKEQETAKTIEAVLMRYIQDLQAAAHDEPDS